MRRIAAPICDEAGAPLGAISVSGPTNRLTDVVFEEEIPKGILSTANVIEVNMAYS